MSSSNPVATIVNNSSVAVEIFDVFNNTGQSGGLLTYTSLGKIAAGATGQIQTLRFASQLQAMYSGPVKALNNLVYNQFPVAVMGVSKLNNVTSFTLTDDDLSAMCQAFDFIKYSTANADSKLAQNFAAALSNTTNQLTAVNNYFAGTGSFKNVTLTHWTAVMSWQTQILSAWQGTYYLYNNVDAQANEAIKLVAIVSIISAATGDTGVLAVADDNGNPGSQTTGLTTAGGGTLCEQNAGEGDLSVSLQPVWINVLQSSGNSVTYLIGSALSGTFNGTSVTGSQQKQALPAATASSSGGNSVGQVVQSVFGYFNSSVNTLISFATMMIMYKGAKEKHTQAENGAENKSATDPKQTKQAIKKDQANADQTYQTELKNLEPKAEEVAKEVAKLPELNANLLRAQEEVAEEGVVAREEGQLEEVLEDSTPNDDVEEAAEKLDTIKSEIPGGNTDIIEQQLNTVEEEVSAGLNAASAGMQQVEKTALEEVKSDIQETNEQHDAIEKASEEQEEKVTEDDSGDLPDNTFDEPEAEGVEEV